LLHNHFAVFFGLVGDFIHVACERRLPRKEIGYEDKLKMPAARTGIHFTTQRNSLTPESPLPPNY